MGMGRIGSEREGGRGGEGERGGMRMDGWLSRV